MSFHLGLIGAVVLSLLAGYTYGHLKNKNKTCSTSESTERPTRSTPSEEREAEHGREAERTRERAEERTRDTSTRLVLRPTGRAVRSDERPARRSLDFGSLSDEEVRLLAERAVEEERRRSSRLLSEAEERVSRRPAREERTEERVYRRRPLRSDFVDDREEFDYEALSPEEKLEFIEYYRNATMAARDYRIGASDRPVRLDARPTGTEELSFNYRALSFADQLAYLDHLEDLAIRELNSERPAEERTEGRVYSRGRRPVRPFEE